MMIAAKLP